MRKNTFKALYCTLLLNIFFSDAFGQQLLPIPDWVKDIGGTGESKTSGIAVDKDDNVYVSGNFQGELTVDRSAPNPKVLTSDGSYDVFVAKYTYDGKLIWATRFGGSSLDQANTLAVDLNGNAYISCLTQSSSINSLPRPGSYSVNGGNGDALVVKINKDGEFSWARQVGGNQYDAGHVVTTDKEGNIILVGNFSSTNVDLGSWTISAKGSNDGFIVKYNTNGDVLWAYGIGSPQEDEIYGVRTNSANEVVIMGYYDGNTDLNPKGPAYIVNAGSRTYYVAKYTKDGSLLWTNTITGSNNRSAGVAINGSDEIYLNGAFEGNVTFNSTTPTNATILTDATIKDLYITKYSTQGEVIWTRRMKGNGTFAGTYSYNITADVDDNVYIGGYFDGTLIFGEAANTTTLTYHGVKDTFFGKYDSGGNFMWAFNFGSPCSGNFSHKIAVDSKKNVLLGGVFCQTVDFNPGNCDLNLTAQHENSDAYLVKYNQIKLTGQPLVTTFSLPQQVSAAVIDNQNKTIEITVAPGTDITKLSPTIMVDIGVLSPLSNTEQDFTAPQKYIVSSNCLDNSWQVTVKTAAMQETEFCSEVAFTITGAVNNTLNTLFQWEIQDVNQNWVNAPSVSDLANYESAGISNFSDTDQILKIRRKTTLNGVDSYDSDYELTIHPSTKNNTISTAQTLYCNGKAMVQITGSTPLGAANSVLVYKWEQSTDGNNWQEIPNEINKDLSPAEFNRTTWFRRITIAGDCEAHSNMLKIEVYPTVTTSNAGTDISVCETGNITLNANAVTNGETGSWSVVSPVDYQPFDATNINNPNITLQNVPKNQEIQLKWTISNAFCPSSSSIIKIYNQSITSNNIITVPTTVFCALSADNLTIQGTVPDGALESTISYTWERSDEGTTWLPIPNINSKNLVITRLLKTAYFRRITHSNDCPALSNVLKITLNKPATIADAGLDISACNATTIELNANAFNVNETGTWSVVSPSGYNPFTPQTINDPAAVIQNFPVGEQVVLKWTIENTACETSSADEITIISFKEPVITLASTIWVNFKENTHFNTVVSGMLPNDGIKWSPAIGLSNPNSLNPVVSPIENQVYTLEIYYGTDCYVERSISVIVVKDLEMGNVFSPNMDGINDEWQIKNVDGHPKIEILVFNRYGEKVFNSLGPYKPWNGTHHGTPLPIGTYYYLIKLNDDRKTMLKGSITIIR